VPRQKYVPEKHPWDDELDYDFFHHQGVPCLVQRCSIRGCLNAYITVPATHPWYNLEADRKIRSEHVPTLFFSRRDPLPIGSNKKFLILGYDNTRDFQPRLPTAWPGEYKTFVWVTEFVKHFAEQAKKLGRIDFPNHPLSPW
jgi:hypothetical protein